MDERSSTAMAPEAVAQAEAVTQPEAATAPEADTRPEGRMQAGADDEVNQQIAEALSGLLRHAHDLAQGIAAGCGLTASDVTALLKLEAPMTMKDLGLKMGCDPSFVTSIADGLESQGLARREPSQRDRRSKNIVLTPEGEKVRERICGELFARAPWSTRLDAGERQCLLGLMRKMLGIPGGR